MKYLLPLDAAYVEAIVAPFHDPEHSHWLNVHIESAGGLEVARDSLWDSTVFSWPGQKAETQFTIKIYCGFETRNYDTVLACLSLPRTASVRLGLIGTNNRLKKQWSKSFTCTGARQEVQVSLSQLKGSFGMKGKAYGGVALQISVPVTNIPVCSLSWIGLRNTNAYTLAKRLRRDARPDWSPWVLPDDAWGEIRFERGLLFEADMLDDVRRKLTVPAWRKHFDLLEDRASGYMKREPEVDFGEYLPNHDARYIREAEHGRTAYHWEALVLGFVGLVREDRKMIRHALRYLMCMVHTRHWTESAEHNIPSSTWSHNSFMEEMTTTSVSILFDWFGFALFPRTRNLIRKNLLQKGMAPVMYDLLSKSNMHKMNQGAVFNRSLILGGLMLEKEWTHFGSGIVDDAYETMSTVLEHYVKSDGGIHEGIAYLCQTMTATTWGIIAYGRARGIDWRQVLNERFASTSRYVAVMSMVVPGRAIPAGDCRIEWFSGDPLPIMAAICPDSAYADILETCLSDGWVHELTGTLTRSGGLVGMVYGPETPRASRSVVPAFDLLPDSGKATISLGNGDATPRVRLWVSGSAQGASHAHRDLGQFCLEVGEDPVFVDRGMVEYWHTEAHILSRSWMHNVFTPVASNGECLNQQMPTYAEPLKWTSEQLELVVPGCDSWEGVLTSYERRFVLSQLATSITVDVIDDIVLDNELGMAVHLHSLHEFQVDGLSAVLECSGYQVRVEFPWAEAVECTKTLVDLKHRPVFHLRATLPAAATSMQLNTRITVGKA